MNHQVIADATAMFGAAHGELERFKKCAEALDRLIGDGIAETVKNTKADDGRCVIHAAAAVGNLEVLKYLIEEIKFDVDVKDNSGVTPLSWAAIEGRLAAVEYLLQMGANPEIPDETSCTSLHHAAMKGHNEVIPLLLSKGINVDVTSELGSPLQHAASLDLHDTVKVLLDHGANPNLSFPHEYTPLQLAIDAGSCQCVVSLLKGGADPNGGPDGVKALLIAAQMGETEIFKLLVKAGADPNVTDIHGLKPIEVAAVKDNRQGVEILFPVTSPIPSHVDWSIDGIMKHVNSKKFSNKILRKANEIFLEAESRGTSALQRKEYRLAVYWYSKALTLKPGDASVLSSRSLCNVYLKDGDLAFEDATLCMLARPDWPEAYYRAGVALKLLNRLDDAANAFFDGLKLDPGNKELEEAFREVSLDKLKAINVPL